MSYDTAEAVNGSPMTTITSLDQFLKVQLQEWGRTDAERKGARAAPVIAITREPGCEGEYIAGKLAEAFDLVLYDWEIVEQIAADAHVSEQAVASLGEQVGSQLNDWLDDFSGGAGISAQHYLQCLRKVLFTIAAHGKAVILGRGANFLLPSPNRTLGVCLVAPLENRARNIMQALGMSHAKALEHIARAEQEQRLWVREILHADINDAANYHLVINTALIKTETIVQIVRSTITTS